MSLVKRAILKTLDTYGYQLRLKRPADPITGLYGAELYRKTFPAESIQRKAFYNLGSGDWRHPFWTNVDYSSAYYGYEDSLIDINWDITLCKPLPVKTASAELVYCSHTVEHLLDEHIDWMLSEACRILKPGGIARITTPNIQLYYEAYKREDLFFNYHYEHFTPLEGHGNDKDALAWWLVNEFATQLVQVVSPGHSPHFKSASEVRAILDTMPMNEALAKIASLLDFKVQQKTPGNHVNWWTNDKLVAALERAGFSRVVISLAGGSISPAMRDTAFFDTVNPTSSLFVEGVKA